MKKKIVMVLLVVGIMLAVMGFSAFRETDHKVNALVNVNIDMSQIRDGSYTGSCDGGLVSAEVRVQVQDHKIVEIELIKHDHLLGKPAEAMLQEMIARNTDDVDVVSGATYSGKVIRSAVNTALQNGIHGQEQSLESESSKTKEP